MSFGGSGGKLCPFAVYPRAHGTRRHPPSPRTPKRTATRSRSRIASAIEADPEPFFARYRAHAQSFEGRYVCSDLFKETFPEFSASNEARGRYNNPLHNSAAVLASEQFRRMVRDPAHPERDTVIFLTGVPGAGKTTAVLDNAELPAGVRLIYEGQLARPATVFPKIQEVIDAGFNPVVIAVHTPAETALLNTLRRFERDGRGASIEAMASIQGGLPQGLAAIHERFGDAVGFRLFDRRGGMDQLSEHRGWKHRSELESEGTYEQLKLRLTHAVDRHEADGAFGPDAIRQARGLSPLARDRELYPPDGREPADPRSREAEGPQPAVVAGAETGRAEGAQARGIEAEQARLRDESAGERYQAALQTYLQANAQRIERIESRLETLIENQQSTLSELKAHEPGFLASRRAKSEWSASLETAQDRLQSLNNRLSRVEEVKEQSAELAEEKMRGREPELANAWDQARQAERNAQEKQRQIRTAEREKSRSLELGRELER